MYYYSKHLDIFYDVYIIYYFVFTMFFIDTFCLLLLLEIFFFIYEYLYAFLLLSSCFRYPPFILGILYFFFFTHLVLQNIYFISLHYSSYYRNFSLSFIIVIPFFLSYLFVRLPTMLSFIIGIPSSIDPLPFSY